MKYYTGQLIEVLLEAYKNASAKIILPAEAHPAPGQYLLINQKGAAEAAFPYTFYPAFAEESQPDQLYITGQLPSDWKPGISLAIRAPLGIPLHIPKTTRRLGLLTMGRSSLRLLAILKEALAKSISLALVADEMPAILADQVEFRNVAQADEIIQWADYLLIDMPISNDNDPKELLITLNISKRTKGMILFFGAYPCGGLADCGLCSFSVSGKNFLACKGGPAFKIADILS